MAKSVLVAYFWWFVGGWLGLHHVYLGRDRHAFITWSLCGGYFGSGLIRDFVKIPEYVRDANDDPDFIEKLTAKMKKHRTPPFSFLRLSLQIITGNFWGFAVQVAVPEDELWGYSVHWLSALVPLACALGVHTVGNIGRVKGSLIWPLLGAYIAYVGQLLGLYEQSTFTSTVAAVVFFEWKAKQWRRTPDRRNFRQRMTILSLCGALYIGLWLSHFYFNATVTDSYGETVKLRDALQNFLKSPLWKDFKDQVVMLFDYWKVHGFSDTWSHFVDSLDPQGEKGALTTLGLNNTATQEEITSKWRQLSKEYHPDRYQDPEKKREAQEKFMELSAAYEILSKIKNKRKLRNQRSQ